MEKVFVCPVCDAEGNVCKAWSKESLHWCTFAYTEYDSLSEEDKERDFSDCSVIECPVCGGSGELPEKAYKKVKKTLAIY